MRERFATRPGYTISDHARRSAASSPGRTAGLDHSASASARPYRVALVEGDGIGPELISATVDVLQALERRVDGLSFDFTTEQGGAECYERTGETMSSATLERLRREYDAVLKGPVGLPEVRRADGTEAGLLGGILRRGLDTYANLRPISLLPGVPTRTTFKPGEVDYVIVRENTEGLYASRGGGLVNAWAASDTLLMTRKGVERVVRFAFDLARRRGGAPRDGARRVTCVDKSNVLRSFAFFRSVFEEVAERYPDVETDYLYADAAAQSLVMEPDRLDVIVTENFIGDMLSDLGGGTVGGIGTCPAANIGDRHAYFEPVHGSAPSLAGRGWANPTAQILSATMMLKYLGQVEASRRLKDAVTAAYDDGSIGITHEGHPSGGTSRATQAIVDHLK